MAGSWTNATPAEAALTTLLWTLVACGPRERVVWDAVGGGDTFDDVAVAVLLFGKVESDREQIDGPHVAGGSLSIVATTHSFGGDGWSADVLEPDVAEIVAATPTGSGLRLDLAFHRAGTTWLHVYDERGVVIDQQRLSVRDPDRAELVPWDDLQTGGDDPLPGPIDVVAGTDASVAVTWLDATGAALDGGGLLVVDAPDTPADVEVSANFTGVVDTLDLSVRRAATAATFPVALSADEVLVDTREVVVHERDEVDAVTLEPGDGTVHALVSAAGARMVGASVEWTWGDGAALEGAILLFEAAEGPGTAVTACFDDVCADVTVDGTPTGVAGADAPTAGSCGCAAAGSGGAWAAAPILAWLYRRRSRRSRRASAITGMSTSRTQRRSG